MATAEPTRRRSLVTAVRRRNGRSISAPNGRAGKSSKRETPNDTFETRSASSATMTRSRSAWSWSISSPKLPVVSMDRCTSKSSGAVSTVTVVVTAGPPYGSTNSRSTSGNCGVSPRFGGPPSPVGGASASSPVAASGDGTAGAAGSAHPVARTAHSAKKAGDPCCRRRVMPRFSLSRAVCLQQRPLIALGARVGSSWSMDLPCLRVDTLVGGGTIPRGVRESDQATDV